MGGRGSLQEGVELQFPATISGVADNIRWAKLTHTGGYEAAALPASRNKFECLIHWQHWWKQHRFMASPHLRPAVTWNRGSASHLLSS